MSEAELQPIEDEAPPGSAGFWVSQTAGGRSRTLHHAARCWRKPALTATHFEWLGEERPASDCYRSVCRDCWPPLAEDDSEDGTNNDDG